MGKNILVVEDDRATMLIYKAIVNKISGWNGSYFTNFDDALRDFSKKKYDIVISDGITGSSIDGVSFLKQVAELSPETLRILISGTIVPVNCDEIHMFIEKNDF